MPCLVLSRDSVTNFSMLQSLFTAALMVQLQYFLDHKSFCYCFSKLPSICGFCITERCIFWNDLGYGNTLILYFVLFSFSKFNITCGFCVTEGWVSQSEVPLEFYKKGRKNTPILSLLPNGCITVQLLRVKWNI